MMDKLIDGYTYEDTAERNDISKAQAIRIVKKCIRKVGKYIDMENLK